jgi:hypothetical protein
MVDQGLHNGPQVNPRDELSANIAVQVVFDGSDSVRNAELNRDLPQMAGNTANEHQAKSSGTSQ